MDHGTSQRSHGCRSVSTPPLLDPSLTNLAQMHDPTAETTRPLLPGQRFPGLGLGREVASLMESMATESHVTDALLNFPFHYHNSTVCTSPLPLPSHPPTKPVHCRRIQRVQTYRPNLRSLPPMANSTAPPHHHPARFLFRSLGNISRSPPSTHFHPLPFRSGSGE
jgi:hypothetical protein